MDTLKLIYNPSSGDKHFKNALDDCVEVFQAAGYEVRLLRADSFEVFESGIARMEEDAVVVAGGDGTVNHVVNALMRYGKDIPLGIIPAGTANDFAAYLKMPKEPRAAAEAIAGRRTVRADLGLANSRYFINVCGAGILANVSHHVDTQLKEALGKLAYYIKGIGQLPNFMPIPLRVTTLERTLVDEFYLFLVLNGSGAGGFDRLSPTARIDDGMLDFVGFKAMSMIDVAALFLKVFTGDYLDDRRVVFMREPEFLIEHISPGGGAPRDQMRDRAETDTDGEHGPDMPLKIKCRNEGISLFIPENYR